MSLNKLRSLNEAIRLIADGAVVALGGAGASRYPMAAIREIIRQRRRNLQVVATSGSLGLELLAAAGCAESTDAAAADRLRAAALGLSMLPLRRDAVVQPAAHLKSFINPFTGETTLSVAALIPDVAILHAHRADVAGHVQFTPDHAEAFADDLMLARAARAVIITVEQIVSAESIASRPAETLLSDTDVTCVIEAPFGAHPFALDHRYTTDVAHLEACQDATRGRTSLDSWIADYVTERADHWEYLDRIGARPLMAVSLNRAARA